MRQIHQAALEHVLRYYDRENGHWDRIKEAEVEISLVKDQYILKGMWTWSAANTTPWKLSTSSRRKNRHGERPRAAEQYQHQLEVYAHLVEERTGQKVSRMHLYYTGEDGGNPYVALPRTTAPLAKRSPGSTRSSRALKGRIMADITVSKALSELRYACVL